VFVSRPNSLRGAGAARASINLRTTHDGLAHVA
jgi:hypothetical protein